MRGNHTTRDLLLTYLRVAGEPRPVVQIIKYLRKMHRIDKGATRTMLWRLCKEGLVERVGMGEYRIADAGSARTMPAS